MFTDHMSVTKNLYYTIDLSNCPYNLAARQWLPYSIILGNVMI
jgi:hypothetical protein